MIKNLRGRFNGLDIAILGSGTTMDLYEEREDIAIAVNGASLTEKTYHIFLAGDRTSPDMDWWMASEDEEKEVIPARIISSDLSPYDPILYPNKEERQRLQEEHKKFIEGNKGKEYPYVHYAPNIPPEKPHLFFRFGGFGNIEKISPKQEVMYWGGTISAIALQLSLIVGAKRVNIYGCGFDNVTGTNYCYTCPKDQKGATTEEQRKIMQKTIYKAREKGIKVNIIGESKLR